jgi:hypothetical protein
MNLNDFHLSKFYSNFDNSPFEALLHVDNSTALIHKSKIPDSNSIVLTNLLNKKRYFRNIRAEHEINETNFFIFNLF